MLDLVPSIGEMTDCKIWMILERQMVIMALLKESDGFELAEINEWMWANILKSNQVPDYLYAVVSVFITVRFLLDLCEKAML